MLTAVLKADNTAHLCEQGVILAAADVEAGLQRCTTLADDDSAAQNCLTAKHLHAESLRV